eukprot:COSAG01_NODE_5761_length_4048_cov_8.447962_7_plen_85_part_00
MQRRLRQPSYENARAISTSGRVRPGRAVVVAGAVVQGEGEDWSAALEAIDEAVSGQQLAALSAAAPVWLLPACVLDGAGCGGGR